jgi:hypothetical protein
MNAQFAFYFILPVIFGVVILVMGVVFVYIDNRRKKERGEGELDKWETTGGKIVASHLNQHEARQENASGTHIDINFEPIIEYVYTVSEVEYRSEKVYPGEHVYFSQKAAQEVLDEHPLNKYVPVTYNPDNPSESMLEKRPETGDFIHVAGLVLTSFGVLVCCFSTFMMLIMVGKYK